MPKGIPAPPGSAQVVSLTVRPSQVSHLCFDVGGILDELNTELGASLTSYPFANLYSALATKTAPNDPSLLRYTAPEILTFLGANVLASLRAEGAKAALSKAILSRQNAYYAKYAHRDDIINRIKQDYLPATTDSKSYRLTQLKKVSADQVGALQDAYKADKERKLTSPGKGVVTATTSVLDSTATGQTAETDREFEQSGIGLFPSDPKPKGAEFDINLDGASFTALNQDYIEETSKLKTHQKITNTDYGFRIPYYECEAQYQRAQISLIDQQFAQFMNTLNFSTLKSTFDNELSNIDSDVYRLQIAYANTLLMSPISGMVTNIYKHPGDAVRAGEPIIRVENSNSIFLMGTLIYAGQLTPNVSTATVSTTVFGSDQGTTPLTGPIVAARGKGQENQWSVVIKCDNPGLLYPLSYAFDYDDTTVAIAG
jgi:biotin carboxyl carrier protein